jgi:hypothetical protein
MERRGQRSKRQQTGKKRKKTRRWRHAHWGEHREEYRQDEMIQSLTGDRDDTWRGEKLEPLTEESFSCLLILNRQYTKTSNTDFLYKLPIRQQSQRINGSVAIQFTSSKMVFRRLGQVMRRRQHKKGLSLGTTADATSFSFSPAQGTSSRLRIPLSTSRDQKIT